MADRIILVLNGLDVAHPGWSANVDVTQQGAAALDVNASVPVTVDAVVADSVSAVVVTPPAEATTIDVTASAPAGGVDVTVDDGQA